MVISIIALLIGILLPVLGSTRATARELQCGNQLRQIGIAMAAVAATDRDRLVLAVIRDPSGVRTWDDALDPYLGGNRNAAQLDANTLPAGEASPSLICPNDPEVADATEAIRSYAMIEARYASGFPTDTDPPRGTAARLDTTPTAKNHKSFVLDTGDLPEASGTLLATEWSTGNFNNEQGGDAGNGGDIGSAYLRTPDQQTHTTEANTLHGSASERTYQYLYADGHIELNRPTDTAGTPASPNRPEGAWSRAAGD